MNEELAGRLGAVGLDPDEVDRVVRTALAEDGDTDVTSEPIFAPDTQATAEVVARAPGVVAGLLIAEVVLETVGDPHDRGSSPAGGGHLMIMAGTSDGDSVVAGDVLLTVRGSTRAVLRAERTVLNFLTHLSGIATLTGQWAAAVEGTKARVRDTRKTLPGLRALQKYAVRCGGGVNHRLSLGDAALVKDNHVAAAGSVTAAYEAIRNRFPELHIQVECDTIAQVKEAVEVGAGSILLDNMSVAEMAEAVRLVGGRAELEASGGLTLEGARDVAVTGVDYLAVGALTHSASALDIALDLRAGS